MNLALVTTSNSPGNGAISGGGVILRDGRMRQIIRYAKGLFLPRLCVSSEL